jgi:type I restriction enzyme, R subunit
MRAANARGIELGLTDDELAFYDALETNDSAVAILGEPELLAIARELTASVRANVTIDWTIRDNVRAQLRVLVKRILRKHGYPRQAGAGDSNRPRAGRRPDGAVGSGVTHR